MEAYQTNNLNQYTKINGTPLSYDLNGNLTDDGKQRYRYDAQNRLIEVESATVKALFSYDALNRCVLRRYFTRSDTGEWVPNEKDSVALTYDSAWNLLVDRDLTGRQTAAYVHGNRVDEILANIQPAKTYYPHSNALGSVIALTDRNGRLESAIKYTAYGLPVSAPEYHRLLYTGREWLASVGLNDHRNRYYNQNSRSWPSTDPIGFNGGLNLYAYAGNSPINYTDNFGLSYGESPEYAEYMDCIAGCQASIPKCKGRERSVCYQECMEEYSKKISGRLKFEKQSDFWDWAKEHAGEIVVGAAVVVGITIFIIATDGAGALILIPLAA